MMTGNGVMHNGTTVIDEYGLNLDRLRVGDRVGVVREDDGDVHFFVNGVDQGVAANQVCGRRGRSQQGGRRREEGEGEGECVSRKANQVRRRRVERGVNRSL